MAPSDTDGARPSWLRQNAWTIAPLILIMALSGVFRIAFNYDAATNDGNYRYAGNDDYYHLRVVTHVQTEGEHLVQDSLLNYPVGANNPRPPLYDWHVAILGQFVHWTSGMPVEEAGRYALEWGSAIWGVLICIPIWLIGRAVYSNRSGLWAAFLVAASPAHIQRAGFGLGDHDAFILFFLTLGFYFLIRALQLTRDDTRVDSWRSLRSVLDGFAQYAGTHSEGLAYAFLAGLSFAAIAVAWEGFPYVPAIFALYYVLQILTNQVRRRDSTGDVLVMTTIMATLFVVAIPYYWTTGNIGSTVTSATYLLLGLLIATLLLVPTRDVPSILVVPGLFVAGALGLLLLYVLVPDVARLLLSANGYFIQSKLYSTIAEAQRTELGVFVFSIGFMTFFLAIIGAVWATVRFFQRRERDQLFIVVWGLFSIYMAFAAARFVFNAAPVFAILAGWMIAKILRWMNFRERVRSFQSQRHEGFGKGLKSLMGPKPIAGSLFLALTLVAPSLWFSLDAGLPSEVRANYRQNHPGARELIENRTGAFGQGFLDDDWIKIYDWLQRQDQGACEGRPGHIAWWDYGFWEVALGCHPTVADNFQNGYQLSGRFLMAQSEQEGIEWLSIRLLEGDRSKSGSAGTLSAPVAGLLDAKRSGLSAEVAPLVNPSGYDRAQTLLREAFPTLEEAVQLYADIGRATQTRISYFLTDLRMLPLDFPEQPGIEAGSIFYAPAFLAGKNPDDFVQTVYVDTRGTEYFVKAYETDENNETRQLAPSLVVDAQNRQWFVAGRSIYKAMDDGKRIDYNFNFGNPLDVQNIKLLLKDPFYSSMFYQGYVGGGKPSSGNYDPAFLSNQPNAGKGLLHFRLVRGGPETPGEAGDIPTIRLLKYYEGAVVRGTVTFGAGSAMAENAYVQVFDDFGIAHDQAPLDEDGTYELLAPFSLPGKNVTLKVMSGASEIANQTFPVSEAEAQRLVDYNLTRDFAIQPGSVTGFVYLDRDRNGSYNTTVDQLAAGANVTIDDASTRTDAQGRFSLSNLFPGSKAVTANLTGHDNRTNPFTLAAGGTADIQVGLTAKRIRVNGTLHNATGGPLAAVPIAFNADNATTEYTGNEDDTTDALGAFEVELIPGGQYTANVNGTVVEDGKTVRYVGQYTFRVELGSGPITITDQQLPLTRTVEG